MTKKTRTILFYFCVFLFILAAPFAVLYSQGYRIDLTPSADGKIFTKTGGLYFKVWSGPAQVYLNDKLKKKTDLFFDTLLLKNLLPDTYKVRIQSDGFLPWEKNLTVETNLVTEAKNIVLIPENPKFNVLIKGIKDFFPAPDNKKIIFKKENKSGWYLTLFDLEKNIESTIIEEQKLSKNGAEFFSLEWSNDSKKIIIKIAVSEREKFFVLELDKTSPFSPISLDFLGNIDNISFNPQDSQKLFFAKNGNFSSTDYITKQISKPILISLTAYTLANGMIVWLDGSGFIFISDYTGKTQDELNKTPFEIKTETEYQLFALMPDVFLKESNSLFYFDRKTENFEKVSDSVEKVDFSMDGKKIMFYNDYEIWIRYSEDILSQPIKKAGDLELIGRFSDKIEKVSWFNNNHLIFSDGNKVKIAEIDDRDKIQTWKILENEFPLKIFWNGKDKKLYFLSNGVFSSSDQLLR